MRLHRTGLLCWAASVLLLVVRGPAVERTVQGLGSPSFPEALGSLLELALLLVAAWTALVLGACRVGGPTAAVAVRLVPRAARGVLVAGVVTGLTVGTAHAAPTPPPAPGSSSAAAVPAPTTLDGLVLPDRPDAPASSGPEPATTVEPPGPHREATRSEPAADRSGRRDVVVVRPGDSLWSIAADRLGAGAGVADVARACEHWYAANRDVVGPDPDVLQPGQRLVAPQEPA